MRIIFICLLLFGFAACGPKNNTEEQKKYMNGFWEIKEVILPDGTVKPYNNNITVDKVDIEKNSGTKSKVTPIPGGSGYNPTTSSEEFVMTVEEDSIRLYYATKFDSWKETVLVSNRDELHIRGKGGRVYIYHRFE